MNPETAASAYKAVKLQQENLALIHALEVPAINISAVSEDAPLLPPGSELRDVLSAMATHDGPLKQDYQRIRTKLRDTLLIELRKLDKYCRDKIESL